MLIYPPYPSPAYSRGRIYNPTLTAPQRRRRNRKQLKRKLQRHDILLKTFLLGAVFVGRMGLIPSHIQSPVTRPEMRRYIAECNTVFFHSSWASRADYLRLLDGPCEVELKLPRSIGPAKGKAVIPEGGYGYFRLNNRHTIMLPTFFRWFNQGFLRYAFMVIEQRSIASGGGEWALMYPEELQAAFQSIDFRKPGTYRASYLVQCLRGENGVVKEMRVYSQNYTPIFRLMIELLDPERVPEVCQPWWSHRSVLLPPYRRDLFKEVTELDEDGLPKFPCS